MQKLIQKKRGKRIRDFKPSMKLLTRIMRVMLEKNSMVRTSLSQEANINYSRLVKHLVWLKQKGLAEFAVEKGKANVVLTANGREFATTINSI